VQRLLIAMSASPAMTAAFGLFVSLADRARLYLPVAFMERQLEPAWSADFHRRHHFKRFSASAGAVLKLQFYMLATAVVVFAWEGQWLVGTLVRPEYAPYYGYIVFMLMQLILGGYQAVLWMGANASRQPSLIWRSNLLAFIIVFVPMVYAGLQLHPMVMLTIASMPTVVWVGYVLTRGSRALGSAVLKTPPMAQMLWLIVVTAAGFSVDTVGHPLLALAAALGTYWLGVAALARLQGGHLLAANEWFAFSHYLGLARRGG
jgi:hypothetical protein